MDGAAGQDQFARHADHNAPRGLLTELSASVAIAGTIACHGTRQALSCAKNCFAKGGGSGAGAPFLSASSASAP